MRIRRLFTEDPCRGLFIIGLCYAAFITGAVVACYHVFG